MAALLEALMGFLASYGGSVAAFLAIFAGIIALHEAGHFWGARAAGIGVEEFAVGLPPRVFRRMVGKGKRAFELSVGAVPFGGFVRLRGEDGAESKAKDAFANRPMWGRLLTIAAGPAVNIALAFVLFFAAFCAGVMPVSVLFSAERAAEAADRGWTSADPRGLLVMSVLPESPASQAGIAAGDFLRRADGLLFAEAAELGKQATESAVVLVEVLPQGNAENARVEAVLTNFEAFGVMLGSGMLRQKVQLPPTLAAVEAGREMYILSVVTVQKIGSLVAGIFSRAELEESIGGPVRIAQMTHHIVLSSDIIRLINFAALLSLSIGLLNLAPFPALDGGRLCLLLLQAGLRRPALSAKIEAGLHLLGFVLLMALLVAVTVRDVRGLF